MSSFVDSKAAFREPMFALGLGDFEKFQELGYDTMGDFAFSVPTVSGNVDDAKFVETVATNILPEGDVTKLAPLRRLLFEAFTMLTCDLRSRIERTDEDKPRKLGLAERASRQDRAKPKLGGLDLTGVHEASQSLEDLCTHMRDQKSLEYVAWERCTTREEEQRGKQTAAEWKPDASGYIKEQSGGSSALHPLIAITSSITSSSDVA